jgi:hypothetical protein
MAMDVRAALLKVTADEPGSLLALEGEKLTLPSVATGLLGGAALAIISELATSSGQSDQFRRPRRVRADRGQGHLVIDDVQVLRNEERSESISLEQVDALTVGTRHFPPTSRDRHPPFSSDHPRSVEVIVHLRDGAGAARDRALRLDIHGMDTCEKVADFAFRLGTAMGLSRQRVVRSDPRRITVEMRGHDAPGLQPMPPPERPADYLHGVVAPGAKRAAAEYRMPAPDPAHFPSGDLRLARWAPGDEIRLDKPAQAWGVGSFLFGTLGVAAGPWWWYLTGDVGSTLMIGIFGLLFGGIALIAAFTCLPRHVRVAWASQELVVAGALRRERTPLSHIHGLALRCVLRWQTAGSRSQYEHRKYSCVLEALVRGEGATGATAVKVMSTREFEDQPETPYDAALPLTRQLADALGVEWRVVDYE